MEKYFTKRGKSPSAENVEGIAELAHQYVQHWTRTEAQRIVKGDLLILPTKSGM